MKGMISNNAKGKVWSITLMIVTEGFTFPSSGATSTVSSCIQQFYAVTQFIEKQGSLR